jgi:hypothetical protein
MSGGYFNYKDFHLETIAAQIELIIENNDNTEKDEWGNDIGRHYPPEIIEKFQETVDLLRKCRNAAHIIDYLLSGDYGEETFLEKWEKDVGE